MRKDKIIYLSPKELKPDPSQPRTIKSDIKIREMAQSIVSNGLINPIEIDKKYMIVTGEMRWLASQEAGLETIPCTIIEISEEDRFFRQVSENIHNDTMNDLDIARALDRLLKRYSPGEHPVGGRQPKDKGIHWLSNKLGKSIGYISEHLGLLGRSKSFIKAVEDNKIPYSHGRAIDIVRDPKLKHKVEKKIIEEGLPRDSATELAHALNRFPSMEKDLLLIETKDSKNHPKGSNQIISEIQEIAPSGKKEIDQFFERGEYLLKYAVALENQLAKYPFDKLIANKGAVVMSLTRLKEKIERYLLGEEVNKTKKVKIVK